MLWLLIFFYYYFFFFPSAIDKKKKKKKRKCLDQAEERAVRTRCVASGGVLVLESREDLSWMGRKEDFRVGVGGESDLTPFSCSMCFGLCGSGGALLSLLSAAAAATGDTTTDCCCCCCCWAVK